MFVVYCLYSHSYDKIYVGFTSNLIARFHSHNSLGKKGYTKKFRPWIVAYTEFYNQKSEAIKREKQLKSANGRAFLRSYIQKHFEE